jgi:prolyl-tRNA editing enzyme YbaK/EbsC (Cys-tRNA(Pro) deacylase)
VSEQDRGAADDIGAVVRARLHELGVEHQVLPCDPALADTAQFSEAYGIPLDRSANTIVVASRTDPPRYAACVVLATTRLDVNRTVRKRLGVRKCSFADADTTRAVTGMEIGGVTAVGLPPDMPLWVDAAVMERDWVILGGGDRSSKLKVDPQVLFPALGAEVVEGLAS